MHTFTSYQKHSAINMHLKYHEAGMRSMNHFCKFSIFNVLLKHAQILQEGEFIYINIQELAKRPEQHNIFL